MPVPFLAVFTLPPLAGGSITKVARDFLASASTKGLPLGLPLSSSHVKRIVIAESGRAPTASQARNVKALGGIEQKRLRVQDFRILFTETADNITIHDIGPRGGIYD